MPLVVRRSAVRLVLLGVAGLLLIVTAIDLLGGHWVSVPPETTLVDVDDPEGASQLTSRGQVTSRTQRIWGYSFVVLGGAATIGAIVSLASTRPLAVIDGDGISLRIAGPGRPLSDIPWQRVRSIRSGVEGVDDDTVPVLVLELDRIPSDLPVDPWEARWSGSTLTVFTGSWAPPAETIAATADLILQGRGGDEA